MLPEPTAEQKEKRLFHNRELPIAEVFSFCDSTKDFAHSDKTDEDCISYGCMEWGTAKLCKFYVRRWTGQGREFPDELNADNKESLSEEALHSDLSDNTASAEGELDGGKTTQLVQSNLQLSPRLQTNEGPDEGPQHIQEHADLGPPTPDCEQSYSTDWERPHSSPVLIDERQGSRNLEDAQPQGTNFTVRELIDVNTSNEQLAVEHLSAHLGSGTDYKIEFKSQLHAADHWRDWSGGTSGS